MKKLTAVFIILLFTSFLFAEQIYFDTRVSFTAGAARIWSRESRLEVKVFGDLSIGAVHSVIDGLGFTGSLESYHAGFYAASTLYLPGIELTPFAGVSLNNSIIVPSSIGFDYGLRSTLKVLPIDLSLCLYGQSFLDSTNLEFFAGPSFLIIKGITFDIGYAPNLLITHSGFSLNYNSAFSGKISLKL